jgi:hypothetical protein
MNLTIDRIEEGIALLIGREDETVRMMVPVSSLPPGSQEGDILTLTFSRDPEATAAAKERTRGCIETMKNRR